MISDLKEILTDAKKEKYAVPAFNVYNMETVVGVLRAAEEQNSPVIVQCYSRLFKEETASYIAPIVHAAAEKLSIPVCFHIDHGQTENEIVRALRCGCTGVMIDASVLDYEENKKLTKEIVKIAAYNGVTVEGELGHVGSVYDEVMGEFTDPDQAADFVSDTGVHALAVLVGNAHGTYKKPPKLDIARIAKISETTQIPLVLHGGSGIPGSEIKEAIAAGICKINFATDVCNAFLDKVFATSRAVGALDNFMKGPIDAVREFAVEKIQLLGSDGKAIR